MQSTEATSTDANPSIKEQTEEPKHVPVYSTFPRRAEQIGTSTSQHVGGEADETVLAYFSFDDKTFLFFSSASCEYDVKGAGIYLAIVQNDYLLSVDKIAEDETYLASTLTKSGILLATSSNANTVLRLLSTRGEICATNKTDKFSSARLTIDKTSKTAIMFATDNSFVYTLNIDDNLAVHKSNFVLYASGAKVVEVLNFGTHQLVFVDGEDGFEVEKFNAKTGFIRQNRLLNCIFHQILPNTSNDIFSFALLLSKEDTDGKHTLVCTLSKEGEILASFLASEVESGVLKQDGDKLILFSKDTEYAFCSHLELVSKRQIALDKSAFVSDLKLCNLEGTDFFFLTDGLTIEVYDTSLNLILSTKGKNLTFDRRIESAGGAKVRFVFEAKSNDALTYTAFGGYDVFVVDVLLAS